MNETSDAPRDDLSASSSRPGAKTWPAGLPAMRLHRRQRTFAPRPPLGGTGSAGPLIGPAPRFLRAKRALVGLALLALAWLGLSVVALLGMSALDVLPIQRLSVNLAVSLVEVIGACWIGLAALGCLFVGAFSMMLALTHREW